MRDFQDNEKSIPTVLTTSQKLSTGVDAPEIRNIVLLRPVKQLIEFKQIVGRGTRLFDGKDYFTIYDFVQAYKNFNDPEWDGEPLDPFAAKIKTGPKGLQKLWEYTLHMFRRRTSSLAIYAEMILVYVIIPAEN